MLNLFIEKSYEIKDHLGNVRAVTSDIKNASNYNLVASSWRFLADIKSMNNYFPYGLKVKEGSWSASNYQFAYNGKQEEVFDKDYLHYGARQYNSKLNIFITTDPKESDYPIQSPYVYGADNPINNFDYNGLFAVTIHDRITENAFLDVQLDAGLLGLMKEDLKFGATIVADYLYQINSEQHFDGIENYEGIKNLFDKINLQIDNLIKDDIGPLNLDFGGIDIINLGQKLHAIQDFYSHSNYVEIYVEYYKKENNGKFPNSVPTFEEGIKIKGFQKLLNNKLRTGDFHIIANEYTNNAIKKVYEIKRINEPSSHNKMNKDKADTPEGKLAEKVATEHTKKILSKVKSKDESINKLNNSEDK